MSKIFLSKNGWSDEPIQEPKLKHIKYKNLIDEYVNLMNQEVNFDKIGLYQKEKDAIAVLLKHIESNAPTGEKK
tara:strand:+ start:556 stop:777 length:222 start_codon:yes stop_codon:yes gene_type:complete